MRSLRFLAAILIGGLVPAYAQFAITAQQNGQALAVGNGGTVTLNTPAIGQSATASLTLTYLGGGTAVFQAPPAIIGPSDFTVTGSAGTLNPFESVNLKITYTSKVSTAEVAQLFLPFNQVNALGVTVAGSAINLSLLGTAPLPVVGQLNANGSFITVPNAGTIQFPDTIVNNASTVTLTVVNTGSGPTTINSVSTTTAEYEFQNLPLLPLTLAAGSQINFTLRFVPLTTGPHDSAVQFTFGSGTYTALIKGNGIGSLLSYQLNQNNTTSPLLPNQNIALSDTQPGTQSTATVQIQNAGASSILINQSLITGAGFSLVNPPFFPVTLAPQQSTSLTIGFNPTQPGPAVGRLAIGSDSFTLTGNGLGSSFQFSYQIGGTTAPTTAGSSIAFPPIPLGQSETLQFSVNNTGTTAGPLFNIAIVGGGGAFQLGAIPSLPFQMNPNGSTSFPITFTPQTTGQTTATLQINSQTFTLVGTASTPAALPSYHFTGTTTSIQAFQQPSIGLSLDAPYAATITGTLTITITSNSFVTDPAVQFSSGGRTVAFTIPANTLQAVFPNGSTQIRLQTGTVASVIQITPSFSAGLNGANITPASPLTLQLTVPSSAPVILSAGLALRTLTSFSITVAGYTPTRYLDHLTFTFTPAAASILKISTVTVDVSSASKVFFQSGASQNSGGQFLLDIPFTLADTTVDATTDLTKSIANVTVTVSNDVGTSASSQVVLP